MPHELSIPVKRPLQLTWALKRPQLIVRILGDRVGIAAGDEARSLRYFLARYNEHRYMNQRLPINVCLEGPNKLIWFAVGQKRFFHVPAEAVCIRLREAFRRAP